MEKEEYSTKIILGVGDGTGRLFVEGDYKSITKVQHMIFELEKLRRENRSMQSKLQKISDKITDVVGDL